MRETVRVAVYAGTFASQPLAFAHLADAVPGLDLDRVEVICGVDPRARLAHVLAPDDVAAVEDALGLHTTVVLVFADALPPGERLPVRTAHLTWLATMQGARVRPAAG
jgi:hypothetical protein